MKDFTTPKIKFYKYYFSNNEKPVIMEAYSREDADAMLQQLNKKTKALDMSMLIDTKIEMPIMGISKRKRMGKTYIWVGNDYSTDGWMEETEFKNKTNID